MTSTPPQGARDALVLSVGMAVASVLNYAFQLHASAHMDAIEFGRLGTWLGYLGVASWFGFFAQYSSQFFALPQDRLQRWMLRIGAAFVIWGVLRALGPWSPSYNLVGIEMSLLSVLYTGMLGQYQVRLAFVPVALMSAAFSILRFGIPALEGLLHGGQVAVRSYYSSHVASVVAASAFGALLCAGPWVPSLPAAPKHTESGRGVTDRLWRAAALAFCVVVFPQLDTLIASHVQTPEAMGALAQVSMFSRTCFVVGGMVLQTTFPRWQQEAQGLLSPGQRTQLLRTENLALWGLLACIPAEALAVPALAKYVLGLNLHHLRVPLSLSALNFALLFALFVELQRRAARSALPQLWGPLCVLSIGACCIHFLAPHSLERSLGAAALLYGGSYIAIRRWPR